MQNLKIMNKAIILLIVIFMTNSVKAQDKIQNINFLFANNGYGFGCLLYTSPSPRDNR